METFIMAQGIPVRVYDSKKGEHTIVLLHGYLETLSVWDDFAEKLAHQYRIISIDLPGHGLSGVKGDTHTMEFMADVLNETLNKLDIGQCIIVGHSMGGYAALAFAKKYPEKMEGLCLFHSTPNPDTDEKKINRDREIELIKTNKFELILGNNIPRIFSDKNVRRMSEKIIEIEENATIAELEGIIACIRGMKQRNDMNPFLKDFTKPLLFIFGAHDNYIPAETATELIERFPQASSLLLANSGHAGFIEEPEASLNKITEFTKHVWA